MVDSKWPVRIGYMGAGLILAAHWTLEPLLFIAGFCYSKRFMAWHAYFSL